MNIKYPTFNQEVKYSPVACIDVVSGSYESMVSYGKVPYFIKYELVCSQLSKRACYNVLQYRIKGNLVYGI